MIHIKEINDLTKQQIEQIRALELQCRKLDGTSGDLWLSGEVNLHEDMPCFFLMYEGEELQGVLTIFAPATAPAEISALVLPECRRRGHFSAMLCHAKQQLDKFEPRDIQLVHETSSEAGGQMIDKWNITPNHSEYLLIYDKNYGSENGSNTNLQLIEAEQKDFDELHKLNKEIFGGTDDGIAQMLSKSINGENLMCFKAILGGETIGVCSVNHVDYGLYIFGFGIAPDFQRKGYGRAMLNELIRHLIDNHSDDILLEVDSTNQSAYLLYTTSGFSIKTQYDYYLRKSTDIPCAQSRGDLAP